MARWEEPHHPGPWVNSLGHANPLCPTLQHERRLGLEPIRRTDLLPAPIGAGFGLTKRVGRGPPRAPALPRTATGLACSLRAMSSEHPSEPPPGADEPYVAMPEEELAPVPDDAGDTRGRHLRRLMAHPLDARPRDRARRDRPDRGRHPGQHRRRRWRCRRGPAADRGRRLVARERSGARGLLQRLRERPRPEPHRRQVEPAAAHPAAAEGRPPLRRAALQRRSCPAT